MKFGKWLVVLALCFPAVAEARWFGRSRTTTAYARTTTSVTTTTETRTAQGVANIMARLGRVGHFGGNSGYEGCGSGPTPASAYNNCCYANSGMATVDVGYARGANGQWFACRRYR